MTVPEGAGPEAAALELRSGLPAGMSRALEGFARADWEGHAHYGGLAAFWRQVHESLKGEAAGLQRLMTAFREGAHDAPTFSRAFGGAMSQHVQHLDLHHRVEDAVYFPKFRAIEADIGRGLDLLEADHQAIHHRLVETVESARTLLRVVATAGEDPRGAADAHAVNADRLLALLGRHLDDEEEIVVPVMLAHGIAA